MKNIKIKNIEVYHGSKIVGNDYYIDHFKKRGKDVRHLIEDVMGRKNRYLLESSEENSITMAITASKKVLEKSNLCGKDIDMIIFSSVLPEYVAPTAALIIHNAIGGKEECFCHDMNVNCIGMTYALDLAYRYLSTNLQISRVLLVGSDYLNPQCSSEDEYCYGQYGDASCAVIIEKTNEHCNLIDTKVTTNSVAIDDVRFPGCGFSNIYDTPKEQVFVKWSSSDTSWLDKAVENMNSILDKNNLTINDISMFCFSQLAYKNITYLREKMNIEEEKSIYIGDIYGYTGTTSPFIALYEAISKGQVKRGDYVMFWTVAAGSIHISLLLKY